MSLLKLRNRFKTVKSLNGMLSAMEVTTLVRIQRVKAKFVRSEKYLTPLCEFLKGRVAGRTLKQKTMLLLTSNRGLCGGFNNNLAELIQNDLDRYRDFNFVTLGENGRECFKRKRVGLVPQVHEPFQKIDLLSAYNILQGVLDESSELHVAYNHYNGTLALEPRVYRLYPIPEELEAAGEAEPRIMEPDPQSLLEKMLRHYIEIRFYDLLLNSQLGELTARLMILNSSVKNSKELIDTLQISINKMRQASITRELTEVVSSAEILRGAENE